MNELDIVKAKRNLSKSVSKGCMGTIVMVYDNPRLAYEVEFINDEGDTVDLITVEPEDLVLVSST